MAAKGRWGDVPAPWGAWLAFGVALVCSGGLPAVAWAGRCCWPEGRPRPLSGCYGALGVTHGHCNGHPTHRGPGIGRLWVGGGMGPVCRACECRNAYSKWGPRGPFVRGPFLGPPRKHKRPRMDTLLCFLLGFVGPDGSGARRPTHRDQQTQARNKARCPCAAVCVF